MPRSMTGRLPNGSLQFVRIGDRQWQFEFPRLTEADYDRFYNALEIRNVGDLETAEQKLLALVTELPEFVDAHHHLAMVQEELGQQGLPLLRWEAICEHVLELLPPDFYFGRDELSWLVLDNRPFLRAYHALGLAYMEISAYRDAIAIFCDLLDLDPGDHQGARALAIDMYFRLRRPFDVLSVCSRFPDDILGETLYGRVLAWFQLGYSDEAIKAMDSAHRFLPLIAKELAKKSHRRPKVLYADRVMVGGADEAYYYWQDQGHFWKDTPGAIDFVRTYLDEHPG